MTNNTSPYNPNQRLSPITMMGNHFNITDPQKFQLALQLLKESLFDKGATLYSSDNVITWNKNLSFLRDERFKEILNEPKNSFVEKSIVWRTYILIYFATIAAKADGDFVECGCHTGFTANQVIKNIELDKIGKNYWLYDLFEWKEGDEHTRFEGHKNEKMYEDTVARFSEHSNLKVIKGSVPESFSYGFPDKISFCHIDMNHPTPEAGALNAVLPRLSKGGVVILDDYGWWGYSAQKSALDPIVKCFNMDILDLPTGQGVLINL